MTLSIDKKEFSSGLCFFLLGWFLAFLCGRLPIWSRHGPEVGFFPFVAAVIMSGFSLLTIIKSLGLNRAKGEEKVLKDQEKKAVNVFRVFSYAVLMLFYGVLMDRLGFLITSASFLILILKYVEKQSWKIALLLGAASIIISYFLFAYLLGVPLPMGLIVL